VTDVTAYAGGPALHNYAVAITGNTDVTLENVSAFGAWASDHNVGILAYGGAQVGLRGGSFTAKGGDRSWAAFVTNSGTTLVAVDVPMLAEGANLNNTAMYPYDGAEVVLRGGIYTARGGDQTNAIADQLNSTVEAYDVTALAEDGVTNYGLGPFDGSSMIVRGATVTARGGESSYAVTSESNATLDAESVLAVAEDASYHNYGLFVSGDGARATARGGSYTGRGGEQAWGIITELAGAFLNAEGVTALGEGADTFNFGLSNQDEALVTLRGGYFTGRGGTHAYGLSNTGSGSMLDADSVIAVGESASEQNTGLRNRDNGAMAWLRGGSFNGRWGGNFGLGILNSAAQLEAEGVTAVGEGAVENYGLANQGGASAVLNGGTFTAHTGDSARGIWNADSNTRLEAYGVTALGRDATDLNNGLAITDDDPWTTLHGGSFTGRGGANARGIYFGGIDNTLAAEGISALAEGAGYHNYALDAVSTGTATADSSQFTGGDGAIYQNAGSLYLGVSKLDGGFVPDGGMVVCYGVYDETYTAFTCP
jgi:hypothetical protein